MRNTLTFEWVLEPEGLKAARTLHIGAAGDIEHIEDARTAHRDGYVALPGVPNAHSHVFQRALRGCGEAGGLDTFWSWRTAMYRLAESLDPESLHALATATFAEMLEAGYTTVGEFHYLHHLPDGTRTTAMADAVIAAAQDAGIRLRLLPVYYRLGGFGRASEPQQRRFVHDGVRDFARTVEACAAACAGLAPHSLRAVPAGELAEIVALADALIGEKCPLHIHVSEQPAEVRDCVATHGRPPILLLDETVGLSSRWCLVHATHAGLEERRRIVAAGATVVLCPLTEGQLGDGWFAAGEFHAAGGRIAIGSDSNVRIDALEEMRFLEFSQRACRRARKVFGGQDGTGTTLWCELARSGAEALGARTGEIASGRAADLVVVPPSRSLASVPPGQVLDALLVSGGREIGFDVYVAGRLRVREGRALAHTGDRSE